jgi:cellulose synthase/poly-beta-1,6-N-acetylglucosamine synthase-like glycosyltransferase
MHSILHLYALFLVIAGSWFTLLSISNAVFFRLSRRRTRKIDGPKISVLIPARNEEKRIRPTLEAILRQDYGTYEVIVIDDNSTDATWGCDSGVCSD